MVCGLTASSFTPSALPVPTHQVSWVGRGRRSQRHHHTCLAGAHLPLGCSSSGRCLALLFKGCFRPAGVLSPAALSDGHSSLLTFTVTPPSDPGHLGTYLCWDLLASNKAGSKNTTRCSALNLALASSIEIWMDLWLTNSRLYLHFWFRPLLLSYIASSFSHSLSFTC